MARNLFILAGEESGDQLGSHLAAELQQQAPLSLWGVGGRALQEQGLEPILPYESFQMMGFAEVLKGLGSLYNQLKTLTKAIACRTPSAVILVDYPDFSLILAKKLRKAGYRGPIVKYVCPTIWAWRKQRIKPLIRDFSLLLTLFPFEEALFTNSSLEVCYTGHPTALAVEPRTPKPDLLALFPGSRRSEITLNFSHQLKAASLLSKRVVVSCARPHLRREIEQVMERSNLHYPIEEETAQLFRNASLALATCGTITLQLALHQIPTVVSYRMGFLNRTIARLLLNDLRFASLPNIISGQPLFPELIRQPITGESAAQALETLDAQREICIEKCQTLSTTLLQPEGVAKAARRILEIAT